MRWPRAETRFFQQRMRCLKIDQDCIAFVVGLFINFYYKGVCICREQQYESCSYKQESEKYKNDYDSKFIAKFGKSQNKSKSSNLLYAESSTDAGL